MDLTLLAPGARRNEAGGLVQNRQGYAQTNVDGQQITTELPLDARQRAAAVQPRCDRGVPGRRQSLRRDAGPLSGHGRQCHHQVGDQHIHRVVRRLLPQRQVQREGLHSPARAAVLEPAVRAPPLAAPSCATGCTSSPATSSSASRDVHLEQRRTRSSTSGPSRLPTEAAQATRARRLAVHAADAPDCPRVAVTTLFSTAAAARRPIRRLAARVDASRRQYFGTLTQVLGTDPSTRSKSA